MRHNPNQEKDCMAGVKHQYIVDGTMVFTEGSMYRVKSGPLKGVVGTLINVREEYPLPKETVTHCFARHPEEQVLSSQIMLHLRVQHSAEWGEISIHPLNVESVT